MDRQALEDLLRNSDRVVAVAKRVLGVRYYWGGGAWGPPLQWPPTRVDCSFLSQLFQARLGLLSPAKWTRTTADGAAERSDAVDASEVLRGDSGFYGSISHQTVVVTSAGHTLSASGGGSATFGDDPDAIAVVENPGYYASGFVTWGRPKEEYRCGDAEALATVFLDYVADPEAPWLTAEVMAAIEGDWDTVLAHLKAFWRKDS